MRFKSQGRPEAMRCFRTEAVHHMRHLRCRAWKRTRMHVEI